jgi:hypothetical protein
MIDVPVEFRPERFSRRGEITAWSLAILALLGWISFSARGVQVPVLYGVLGVFLFIAGFAISLSNWSDRRTMLRLENDGVHFENGLRQVHLTWGEIQKVEIFTSNLGDRVRVSGAQKFFSFRLLGEVSLRGQVRGRMGFSDGERILAHILKSARLKRVDQPGVGYYYTRE